jgi:phosphoglycolate phosphatase-like HAD superfamily hydrolase
MKKKLLFLDGDGTLWYPKKTLRTQKPHWVYSHPDTKDAYLEHLTLTPQVKETLETLKSHGLYLVVISANPYDETRAVKEIGERLAHFGLTHLFYACRASSGEDPKGKTAIMLEIIAELGVQKSDALMVGDSYFYDYLAAKDAGIDAFFIHNPVAKMPDPLPQDLQSIHEVSDLLQIMGL